jgi:hypothetical protein
MEVPGLALEMKKMRKSRKKIVVKKPSGRYKKIPANGPKSAILQEIF